jgi:hypothetical protein
MIDERRQDSGAPLIEMAMVFGLLAMMLVSVIASANTFGQKNSVENPARETSRYAATLPGPVDTSWLRTVRDVARAAAQGELNASVPGQYICVAHINSAAIQSLENNGGVKTESGTECFSGGLPADEVRIQVVTRRDTKIQGVFFSVDVTLDAPAVARYERES